MHTIADANDAINNIALQAINTPATAIFNTYNAWPTILAEIASAIATELNKSAPVATTTVSNEAKVIAASLLSGERKAILLGSAAAHHPKASGILSLANWIGQHTNASVGYLTEAANTVGAQYVGAQPLKNGLSAGQMLSNDKHGLKAVLLLNNEPEFDSAAGKLAKDALLQAQMVVSMNPFKANMDVCDVMLPTAPFTETSGSFVNAEGRLQSFHAVVKPLGETRPAWKVMRVLANMLSVPGFDFESSADVLKQLQGQHADIQAAVTSSLSNLTDAKIDLSSSNVAPVTASIYQLDGIVRRAPALQATADANIQTTQMAKEQEVSA